MTTYSTIQDIMMRHKLVLIALMVHLIVPSHFEKVSPTYKTEIGQNIDDPLELEYAFFETYGMDEFTPGLWEGMRDFKDDLPKHARLCQRAHNTSGTQPPGIVDETGFCQKTLQFRNESGYRSMELDVLLYTIKGHRKNEFWPYFFYISKGVDHGCVCYVKPIDENAKNVQLERHVCKIDMHNIFHWPEEDYHPPEDYF